MGKKAVLAFVSTLLALAFASKEAASSINISLVNVLPEEFAPATEIRGKELLLLTNVTRLEVRCSAKFPIQWEFKGDTSPLQLHVRASRTTGTNLGDAVFNVDLIVYRVSAAVTGTYICRSVNNAHKSSELHIFAQEKGYRGQDPVLIKYGRRLEVILNPEEPKVLIPCTSWDPKSSFQLYKKSARGGKYEEVRPSSAFSYDPKRGFDLEWKELEEPFGEFLCTPDISRTFDRVYVSLLQKPDYRVFPETRTIEVADKDSFNIRCESQLPDVNLRVEEGDENDSRISLERDMVQESEFPYTVSLNYSNLRPEDAVKIQCVRNGEIMHTWEVRVASAQDLRRRGLVKYHSRRTNLDWFACWARSSRSPDFSFVECLNPMECQIRSQCLKNGNKCDSAMVQLCSGGCAIASIENRTGILHCKGDGVDQEIRQFVGISGLQLYNSMTEAPKEERLGLTGKHVFKAGAQGEFVCSGSSFLFSGGFRWGLKSKGEPLKLLEPGSEEVVMLEENFTPTGHIIARAKLDLNSKDINQITCFSPVWNSTEWESRNHPIFVHA